MIRARKKSIAMIIALVFLMSVMMPMAAFADDADISGTFKYVTTGDGVECGKVTVAEGDDNPTTHTRVAIKLSLPDGVAFNDTPEASDDWYTDSVSAATYEEDVDTGSSYYEIELKGDAGFDFDITFNFSGPAALDIDDDFAGNLDVDVEVIGLDGSGDVVWTEAESVTIAKVAGGDVTVSVDDPKKVSMGGGKSVADITLEESAGGVIGIDEKAAGEPDEEVITLEIETDGVEFDSMTVSSARFTLKYGFADKDGDPIGTWTAGDEVDFKDQVNKTIVFVRPDAQTGGLPGKITFEDIKVSVAPDVTGDIEISVVSNGDADISEDVVVATVGDVTAELSDIEDNDTVAYAGQETELDVEFTIATTDGNYFDGEIITFELNQGTVEAVEASDSGIRYYSDDEAFYVTLPAKDKKVDEITISDIKVALDNDAEVGDLVLSVGGDYELDDIVIGEAAKPYTVSAEKPAILSEALNQAAGDIIITEADAGAFAKEELIVIELPSGLEFAKKPSVEVTEGSANVKIFSYDDDAVVLQITKESGSKASVIRVYNIAYDTGRLALIGDVNVKFGGDWYKAATESDPAEYGDDDSLMCAVANAVVDDQDTVKVSFTVGDEGVAVVNGRTLVQVNLLGDDLGLQKSWDAAAKTAYFVKDGKVVAFPMNENAIYIGGVKVPMDQGGMIINDFTYATLRGLQAAFGGDLDWDNETKTATFEF